MEQMIKNISELEEFAQVFAQGLPMNEMGATVIGLSGDLGSGKTAFTKALAKALGVTHEILSPTFVIAKFYDIPDKVQWRQLVHIDAYRIDDVGELRPLKWNSIIVDHKNLVVMEWPEKIHPLFPKTAHVLRFRFIDETTRGITKA